MRRIDLEVTFLSLSLSLFIYTCTPHIYKESMVLSRCGRVFKKWQIAHSKSLNKASTCVPKSLIFVVRKFTSAQLWTYIYTALRIHDMPGLQKTFIGQSVKFVRFSSVFHVGSLGKKVFKVQT